MNEDRQLLAEFCQSASEAAFRQLVERHLKLVYSTARRLVNGDTHQAQDISQSVFSNLARKARSLPANVLLAGWLHRDTRFTALEFVRKERRRVEREREAAIMHELETSERDMDWSRLRPLLDEILDEIDEEDRHALLLRFFEQQNLAAVGATLGLAEDTARKRVSRALDRLRQALLSRGITTTAALLSAVLTTRGAESIPAGLSAQLARTALAAGSTTTTATTSILALMTSAKLTTLVVVSAGLLLIGGVAVKLSMPRSNSNETTGLPANGPETNAARTTNPLVARRNTRPGLNAEMDPTLAAALARVRDVLYGPPSRQRIIPNPALRDAMGALGDRRAAAIPLLREALADSRDSVRLGAAEGLGVIGPEARDEAAALVTLLKNREYASTLNITWALRQMGPLPELLPAMAEVLMNNPDRNVSLFDCIGAMAGSDSKLVEETMSPLLSNDDLRIRQTAACVLAGARRNKSGQDIVRIAIESLKSSDLNSQYLGLETVERIARDPANRARLTTTNFGPATAEVLAALTGVANDSTLHNRRTQALTLLNELNPELRKQHPELDAWLHNQDETAAFTQRIHNRQATVPEMIQGLRQFPVAIPVTAGALGRLGPAAQASLPALHEALVALQPQPGISDHDRLSAHNAREAVANAIQKIAPDQPKPLFTRSDVRSMMDLFEAIKADSSRMQTIATALQPVLAGLPDRGKELTPDEMRRVLNVVKAVDAPMCDAMVATVKKIDPWFSLNP